MLQFPIESVMLLNYWQRSSADPNGCLLCLPNAILSMIDSEGAIVGSQATGKTCGKHALLLIFFLHPQFTFEPKWNRFSLMELLNECQDWYCFLWWCKIMGDWNFEIVKWKVFMHCTWLIRMKHSCPALLLRVKQNKLKIQESLCLGFHCKSIRITDQIN